MKPKGFKIHAVEYTLSVTCSSGDVHDVHMRFDSHGSGFFVEMKSTEGIALDPDEILELAQWCADVCKELDEQERQP